MHECIAQKRFNEVVSCPHCNLPINKTAVTKNRLLLTIYDLIKLYKSTVTAFQREAGGLKHSFYGGSTLQRQAGGLKQSFCEETNSNTITKSSKIINTTINFEKAKLATSMIISKSLTSNYPNSQTSSLTRLKSSFISPQKRQQQLKIYADKYKIQQLKAILSSNIPFEQVSKLRSGYGLIKKIQCMELFPNLRQLYLYNNLIESIDGLNVNMKLNILSLANNKITLADNIGHLKEMKRLSLEGNLLGKTSAEYLCSYQWKNLDTLNISFHCESKAENDECIDALFNQAKVWVSLKTVYIYNGKGVTEKSKAKMKNFVKNRTGAHVYWH